MYKTTILLNTVEKIKEFVSITTKYNCDFDIASGRYVVDGKSIMGIFALDVSKPHTLSVITEDQRLLAQIRDEISRFAV